MLKLIASQGSVSLQDVAGDRDMFTVSEDVRLLEELSIITREYVVYCVETDQKVSCVSNFAAIEEAAQRGFKCFHCGRPISQEKVVQILSITESGRRLATKNMWLAYLVGATLCDEGVAPESLLIRSEHNDEIVEVFANVQGSMLMYEVSEQEITADVAFRFLNRTRFFNPQWAYLVTPQAVGNDAQAVIASASEKLAFISDLQKLPEIVRQSVLKAGQKILGDLLASFNGLTELEIGNWASAYLLCKREECQPVDDVAVVQPEPEPSEVVVETPEAQSAQEPSVEEAEPVFVKNEEPSQEIKAEEPMDASSQPSGEVDIAPEPVIPALAHASINGEGNNCYKVLQQVLDLLPGACASTEFEEVSALIDEVADLSDFSMMIANPDGTPFLGCLDTASDSDLVAALQTDLTQGLNNIAAENNLGSLASVLLCNKEATMRVYVSADEFNVLAHRLVPEVAEVKAERKRTTPKLKKALQSLTGLPGVNGSMVVREDGTLVQSFGFNGTDSEQITALASCSAQMVNETIQGFCAEVSFNDLRAAIVCTDKAVFHILLLEGSYYLVTELNTKVADYVWSSDLSEEAGMVLANL